MKSFITKKRLLALVGIGGGIVLYRVLRKALKQKKEVLYMDFDGTICDDKLSQIGRPKKGVRKAFTRLIKKYDIVIHSVRTAKYWRKPFRWHRERDHVKLIKDFMKKHKIPYTRIELDHDKPLYYKQIDDRGIEFTDNWDEITKRLMEDETGTDRP